MKTRRRSLVKSRVSRRLTSRKSRRSTVRKSTESTPRSTSLVTLKELPSPKKSWSLSNPLVIAGIVAAGAAVMGLKYYMVSKRHKESARASVANWLKSPKSIGMPNNPSDEYVNILMVGADPKTFLDNPKIAMWLIGEIIEAKQDFSVPKVYTYFLTFSEGVTSDTMNYRPFSEVSGSSVFNGKFKRILGYKPGVPSGELENLKVHIDDWIKPGKGSFSKFML